MEEEYPGCPENPKSQLKAPPVPAPTLDSDFAKIQKLTWQYLVGQESPGPCFSLHPYWLVSSPCWLLKFLNINPNGTSHMGQKGECLLLLGIFLDLRPSGSLFLLIFWKVWFLAQSNQCSCPTSLPTFIHPWHSDQANIPNAQLWL